MKRATYTLTEVTAATLALVASDDRYSLDGVRLTVEYDDEAPCISCGLPVWEASVGGTAVCPWCDCGNSRHLGQPWQWGKTATDEEYLLALEAYRASKVSP